MRFPRRLFLSVLIVLLWLGFVVDGTRAVFTDTASLTGNTITTGTASLLISNSQNSSSTLFDESRPGFALNLTPGHSQENFFFLKNTSAGEVDFDISLLAALQSTNPLLSQNIEIGIAEADQDGNMVGTETRLRLATLQQENTIPFTVPKGVTKRFKLRTTLLPDHTAQGETIGYDLIFRGTQHIGAL